MAPAPAEVSRSSALVRSVNRCVTGTDGQVIHPAALSRGSCASLLVEGHAQHPENAMEPQQSDVGSFLNTVFGWAKHSFWESNRPVFPNGTSCSWLLSLMMPPDSPDGLSCRDGLRTPALTGSAEVLLLLDFIGDASCLEPPVNSIPIPGPACMAVLQRPEEGRAPILYQSVLQSTHWGTLQMISLWKYFIKIWQLVISPSEAWNGEWSLGGRGTVAEWFVVSGKMRLLSLHRELCTGLHSYFCTLSGIKLYIQHRKQCMYCTQ